MSGRKAVENKMDRENDEVEQAFYTRSRALEQEQLEDRPSAVVESCA